MNLSERLLTNSHIDVLTGCRLWELSQFENGYGKIRVHRKTLYVHRVAYTEFVGPIPEGLTLDHVYANGCRYRHCLNWAEHLEPVTRGENLRRRAALITHCPMGHEYTAVNTYVGKSGKRQCRACKGRWR